jgi:hypothetical protein
MVHKVEAFPAMQFSDDEVRGNLPYVVENVFTQPAQPPNPSQSWQIQIDEVCVGEWV